MLLKSRVSLTCFRACFLPGLAKDLSVPRYNVTLLHVCVTIVVAEMQQRYSVHIVELYVTINHIKILRVAQQCSYAKFMSPATIKRT